MSRKSSSLFGCVFLCVFSGLSPLGVLGCSVEGHEKHIFTLSVFFVLFFSPFG